MNSKGHLYVSAAKSALRILSCIVAIMSNSLKTLAVGLLLSEVLGVAEELVDHR